MRRTILLLTLLLALSATKSSAVVDSMYANFALLTNSGPTASYATGAPDGQQAILPPNNELFVGFMNGTKPIEFASGAKFHIYWKKESSDSAAAILYLLHYSAAGAELYRDSVALIDQAGMVTVQVPKAGYNGMAFALTSHPPANDGSQVFFVDAVTLVQSNLGVESNTTPFLTFSMYPNPAAIQTGITLNVPEEYIGHSQVVVYDLLGNQVLASSVDQSQMHLQMDAKGIYIARLVVDGAPLGDAFKFSVE